MINTEWDVDGLLEDMVHQHCSVEENGKNLLDSMALSANADAMRYLASKGIIRIIREHGRRIIAEYPLKGLGA